MRRVVWVLGVLAVLAVALSATLAATVAPSSSRQWLGAYGVEVAVPATGWRLEPASSAIEYAADALVRAPAVLDSGFCPSSASSSRAFVGLLAPATGTVSEVLTRQLGTWATAIRAAATRVPAVRGSRADLDVPVPAGPCAPTTAHLTLVGQETSAGVVVLVLVRDVGEPGDLTAAEAERIVASARASRD